MIEVKQALWLLPEGEEPLDQLHWMAMPTPVDAPVTQATLPANVCLSMISRRQM